MSLLDALSKSESERSEGWSHSNMFSTDDSKHEDVNVWPTPTEPKTITQNVEDAITVPVKDGLLESAQISDDDKAAQIYSHLCSTNTHLSDNQGKVENNDAVNKSKENHVTSNSVHLQGSGSDLAQRPVSELIVENSTGGEKSMNLLHSNNQNFVIDSRVQALTPLNTTSLLDAQNNVLPSKQLQMQSPRAGLPHIRSPAQAGTSGNIRPGVRHLVRICSPSQGTRPRTPGQKIQRPQYFMSPSGQIVFCGKKALGNISPQNFPIAACGVQKEKVNDATLGQKSPSQKCNETVKAVLLNQEQLLRLGQVQTDQSANMKRTVENPPLVIANNNESLVQNKFPPNTLFFVLKSGEKAPQSSDTIVQLLSKGKVHSGDLQNESSDKSTDLSSPQSVVNSAQQGKVQTLVPTLESKSPTVTHVIPSGPSRQPSFVSDSNLTAVEKNCVYNITTDNGTFKVKYNGSSFEAVDSNEDASVLKGGGAGQGKKLHGNATGLNMVQSNQNASLPVSRTWNHTDPPTAGNSLLRTPLQGQIVQNSSNKDDKQQFPSYQSQAKAGVTQESSLGRERRKPGCFVSCKACGYTSFDLICCERCHRNFSINDKVVEETKQEEGKKENTCSADTASKAIKIATNQFYTANVVRLRNGQQLSGPIRRIATQRKPHVIETVTIVSSDDEEDKKDSNGQEKLLSQRGDNLSCLVNSLPSKRPASPCFNQTRVSKMEDESGKPIQPKVRKKTNASVKICHTKNSNDADEQESLRAIVKARSVRVGSLKAVPVEPIYFGADGIQIDIECEKHSNKFLIEPKDLKQCLLHLKKVRPVLFLLTNTDFAKVLRGKLSMEDTPPQENILEVPYYDPDHTELMFQYITILPEHLSIQDQNTLQKIFNSYNVNNFEEFICPLTMKQSQDMLVETTPNGRQMVNNGTAFTRKFVGVKNSQSPPCKTITLVTVQGQTVQALTQERSPSPPKITFSGPIEKLLTYPTPPAIGAITITNEDLYCLNEGEFLNDVILDFYLKYLYREILSPEDRERTHIFSSFFFECLSHRNTRTVVKDDANTVLTPAQKRHQKVKKWTKHVDLFSKDFIIVPINEHAHWFLAIICFPGLQVVKKVKYLPKPAEDVESSQPNTPTPVCSNPSQPMAEENTPVNPPTAPTPDDKEDNGTEENCAPADPQQSQGVVDEPMEGDNEDIEGKEDDEEERKEEPMEVDTDPKICRFKEVRGKVIDEDYELQEDEHAAYGMQFPCILIFDSLAGTSRARVVQVLKEYLQVEWDSRKKEPYNIKSMIRGCTPRVPQQTNFSDCGVYVLQYAERFFEDPIIDFTIPIRSLQTWFSEERVTRKRQDIKELIMSLKDKFDKEKQGLS